MSSKHKKKKRLSPHKKDLLRAECKKHFFERVRHIFSFAGGEAEFDTLTKRELERIYFRRGIPFKIIMAPGDTIPEENFKEIKHYVINAIKMELYPLTEKGDSLSLFELFTVGLSVIIYLEQLEEDDYKNAGEVKKLQNKFKSMESIIDGAGFRLLMNLMVTGFMESDLTSRFYWLDYDPSIFKTARTGIKNTIVVHSTVPEKISVALEGDKYRPAFKIYCIYSRGTQYIRVKRSLLGLKDYGADSEIDLYIQMHAVQRLKERLDCLDIVGINICLYFSLKESKIINAGKNDYLIEFRIDSIVVGYLVAHIQEEKLIIRTFLFVTQSGTPEGEKLKELYGLGRLDVSYLELDKLSTYIYTDLCTNPGVSKIFREAGCQYLLDLYTDSWIKNFCHDDKNYSRMELLIKYLGIEN